MTRGARGTSPPETPGGDDARELYDELTDDLLYDPAIGRATMMGYPCVRLAGRFLASYDDNAGALVVKLPSERVLELIETGDGEPFAPAGRTFREWAPVPAADRTLWQTLLTEAVDFARKGAGRVAPGSTRLGDRTARRWRDVPPRPAGLNPFSWSGLTEPAACSSSPTASTTARGCGPIGLRH